MLEVAGQTTLEQLKWRLVGMKYAYKFSQTKNDNHWKKAKKLEERIDKLETINKKEL